MHACDKSVCVWADGHTIVLGTFSSHWAACAAVLRYQGVIGHSLSEADLEAEKDMQERIATLADGGLTANHRIESMNDFDWGFS